MIENITPKSPPTISPATPTTIAEEPKKNDLLVVVIVLIFLFILGSVIIGGIFIFFSNQGNKKNLISQSANSLNTIPITRTKSAYDILSEALNKTIAASTVYLEYKTKVASHVTSSKTGVTQTLHNNVDGSISGSTDGKTMAMEMRIFSDDAPDKSVNVSVLTTENDDWYIRNSQTAPKWQKLTKEQYEQYNSAPTDASLFGLILLGTIFSENKGLLKSVNRDSVVGLGDEQGDGTTYSKFRADVSTPDFLNALGQDEDLPKKDVEDARKILKDSILTVTYYVDKNSGYIGKLNVEAKSLTQITTPEAIQLGVSAKHDLILDANLSRFGIPTNITVPSTGDVLGVSAVAPQKPKLPL
ncbi:hypothetical protein HY345_03500 [Candidatus Microgenomates bacterium]|nr:hypothetical protein [Candidatus Microgenomates bacterium]